jgi:uncharacterized protein YgiM (DUF1202 family)
MKTKKRYLSCCLSFSIILLISSITSDAKTLTVSGNHLNVRSGPGRTYDVVELVNKNEKFEILDEKDGWYKISVEGTVGWISEKAVTVTDDTEIQEMLKRADLYFTRQQLMTPPEANAFDIYQEVLRRDPGNSYALKKIDQMAKIYKMWADRAYQRGDYSKAETFYQRYLFIVPDDQQVREFLTHSNNPVLNPESVLQRIHLRNDPATLSKESIGQIIRKYGFNHPADWSKYGLSASITGNFQHQYEINSSNGVNVVIDYATQLMWQQSGTRNPMTWSNAQEYIFNLKSERYGGYSDWRLPTIEELASLLEPTKQNANLYIAPVFGTLQVWCWSADKVAFSPNTAWYISFSSGGIEQQELDHTAFVLAVRSIQRAE